MTSHPTHVQIQPQTLPRVHPSLRPESAPSGTIAIARNRRGRTRDISPSAISRLRVQRAMSEISTETGIPTRLLHTHLSLSPNPSEVLSNTVTLIETFRASRERIALAYSGLRLDSECDDGDDIIIPPHQPLFPILPPELLEICTSINAQYLDLLLPSLSPHQDPPRRKEDNPPSSLESIGISSPSPSSSSSYSSLDSLLPSDDELSPSLSTSPSSVDSLSDLVSGDTMRKFEGGGGGELDLRGEDDVDVDIGEGLVVPKEGLRGWRGTWVDLEDTPLCYEDEVSSSPPYHHPTLDLDLDFDTQKSIPPTITRSSKAPYSDSTPPRFSPSSLSDLQILSPSPTSPTEIEMEIELHTLTRSSHRVFKVHSSHFASPSMFPHPHSIPIPPVRYYAPIIPKPALMPRVPSSFLDLNRDSWDERVRSPRLYSNNNDDKKSKTKNKNLEPKAIPTPRPRVLCDTLFLRRLATRNLTRVAYFRRTIGLATATATSTSTSHLSNPFPPITPCPTQPTQISYAQTRTLRRILTAPTPRILIYGSEDKSGYAELRTEVEEGKVMAVCWEGRGGSSLSL